MKSDTLNRRQFHQITAAALGGMIAGATLGCSSEETANAGPIEKHLCRGLNTCKGNGAGGDNACAGQGACATVEHQSCGGKNACKNLGGCGEEVGQNECKGQGGCQVPLMESAWETMRTRIETRMNEKGKEFGEPPVVEVENHHG
jgi:hypothetical protein